MTAATWYHLLRSMKTGEVSTCSPELFSTDTVRRLYGSDPGIWMATWVQDPCRPARKSPAKGPAAVALNHSSTVKLCEPNVVMEGWLPKSTSSSTPSNVRLRPVCGV